MNNYSYVTTNELYNNEDYLKKEEATNMYDENIYKDYNNLKNEFIELKVYTSKLEDENKNIKITNYNPFYTEYKELKNENLTLKKQINLLENNIFKYKTKDNSKINNLIFDSQNNNLYINELNKEINVLKDYEIKYKLLNDENLNLKRDICNLTKNYDELNIKFNDAKNIKITKTPIVYNLDYFSGAEKNEKFCNNITEKIINLEVLNNDLNKNLLIKDDKYKNKLLEVDKTNQENVIYRIKIKELLEKNGKLKKDLDIFGGLNEKLNNTLNDVDIYKTKCQNYELILKDFDLDLRKNNFSNNELLNETLEKEKLKNKLKDKINEILLLEKSNKKLANKISDFEKLVKILKSENKNISLNLINHNNIKNELNCYKDINFNLENNIKNLTEINNKNYFKYDELNSKDSQIESIKCYNKELIFKLNNLNHEYISLEKEFENSKKENLILLSQLKNTQDEKKFFEIKISEKIKEEENILLNMNVIQNEINNRKNDIETIKSENLKLNKYKDLHDELLLQNNNLYSENQTQNRQIIQLKDKICSLNHENKELKDKNTANYLKFSSQDNDISYLKQENKNLSDIIQSLTLENNNNLKNNVNNSNINYKFMTYNDQIQSLKQDNNSNNQIKALKEENQELLRKYVILSLELKNKIKID